MVRIKKKKNFCNNSWTGTQWFFAGSALFTSKQYIHTLNLDGTYGLRKEHFTHCVFSKSPLVNYDNQQLIRVQFKIIVIIIIIKKNYRSYYEKKNQLKILLLGIRVCMLSVHPRRKSQ